MTVDWERRRRNLRILIAAAGTNATRLAADAGVSPNTISKFTSGHTKSFSETTFQKIAPFLDLRHFSDLDTDNPISDPKVAIERLLDQIPDSELPGLLTELKDRFGHNSE